jgi:CHAT domain-containing protein
MRAGRTCPPKTITCLHATHLVPLAFAFALAVASLAAAPAALGDIPLSELRMRVERAGSPSDRVEGMWALADAQSQRGLLTDAARTLRAAAAQSATPAQQAATAVRLATVLGATGQTEEAAKELAIADGGRSSFSVPERVALDQAHGIVDARNGDFVAAETAFEAAAGTAHSAGSGAEELRARLNALRARMDRKDIASLEARLGSLESASGSLPRNNESAVLLLALGELFERSVQEFRSPPGLRGHALALYSRAADLADDAATRAYVAGLTGALYEDEGRDGEALRLTLQAVALAQSVGAEDQLYRWEWQAGRLQHAGGEDGAAVESVDRALFTLAGIRTDVMQSSRQAFAMDVEPIYLGYADLHLRQAAALADGSPEQQRILRDVRDQLETLKQAEVQDYFDNGCITSTASRGAINLPGVAVVYPILLSERTEVLIETNGTLRRFSAPISRGQLTATVRRMRLGLERPSAGDAFRDPAQQLYKWLLGDATNWLRSQQVKTLVFVPSGPLRTIPLSALLEGNVFLIERFAIATTPAMSLVGSVTPQPANEVLLAGLTESVQGFAGLPSVSTELHSISAIYPAVSLKDETFSLVAIRTDLSKPGFSVAHLATHGEFSADHRQSFILTYDNRLTMDGLQAALARRGDPLDLLVLSACSTAAGDDRAALGLAGVAIQAGAKSALASLWSISDEATASLMSSFYKSLKTHGESKAESLRDAQLALLHTPEFRHPSYWAPYLLIGNWL